jgi:hypothetical protein
MPAFVNTLVYNFLIAFGVIVGASIFAGLAAIITDEPPLKTMYDIAGSIRIWAIAVALGGTFSSFEVIEKGLLKGEFRAIIKQAAYVVIAVTGANAGSNFIRLLQKCGEAWVK